MQWKILIFLIFNLTICERKENNKYYFCNGKIFDPDIILSSSNINYICSLINNDKSFMINIQKKLSFSFILNRDEEDQLYTRDSEDMFITMSNRPGINREYLSLLSIYADAKKARLTFGKYSTAKRNVRTILSKISPYLSDKKYLDAIVTAIDMIGYEDYNNKSSGGVNIFVIIIIIITILICAFIIYSVTIKNKQEVNNQYEYTDNSHNSSMVYNHLHKLQNMLKKMKKNSPPIISTKKCLICMEKMKLKKGKSFEMNNFNEMNSNLIFQNDNTLTRYNCSHLFHTSCLQRHQLYYCIMCNTNITIPNNSFTQVVDENNINSVIKNIHKIYNKELLEDFAKSYPDDYNYLATFGLIALWGLTAVATVAILDSAINNYEYNSYNNYERDSGDINTASADF
jgi:hypothetical protein